MQRKVTINFEDGTYIIYTAGNGFGDINKVEAFDFKEGDKISISPLNSRKLKNRGRQGIITNKKKDDLIGIKFFDTNKIVYVEIEGIVPVDYVVM